MAFSGKAEATPASVVFQIFVDDKKAFDSGVVHENDPSRAVTVSVEGAKELRLVVNDAGDGINYDAADWAEARLDPRSGGGERTAPTSLDVAPFALVASWDPKVMTGTKANRVQEIPAEDIAPYKELLPSSDGTYLVPETNGQGCIGLQWLENRLLRRVALQFPSEAAVPSPESVQLQYWVGGSAWQGAWQKADIAPKKAGNTPRVAFGFSKWPAARKKCAGCFCQQPSAQPSPKGRGDDCAQGHFGVHSFAAHHGRHSHRIDAA